MSCRRARRCPHIDPCTASTCFPQLSLRMTSRTRYAAVFYARLHHLCVKKLDTSVHSTSRSSSFPSAGATAPSVMGLTGDERRRQFHSQMRRLTIIGKFCDGRTQIFDCESGLTVSTPLPSSSLPFSTVIPQWQIHSARPQGSFHLSL